MAKIETRKTSGPLLVALLIGFALGWCASLSSNAVGWNDYASAARQATTVERRSCGGESEGEDNAVQGSNQSIGKSLGQQARIHGEKGVYPTRGGENLQGFWTNGNTSSVLQKEVAKQAEDPATELLRVTTPWSNVTTIAYFDRKFYAGYRNQMMAFTSFVMEAVARNASQILLPTLKHKDTLATKSMVKHETFFDVIHWNSHYPKLPRLVRWDPVIHDQIDCSGFYPKFLQDDPEGNSTRPMVYGRQPRLMLKYIEYSKGNGPYAKPSFRNEVELTMMNGGMRPHPELLAIMNKLVKEASLSANNSDGRIEYMTLHARVEPDMQKHTVCLDRKERNLTEIFRFLEEKFPDPPAPVVFMPINRQLMETVVGKQETKAREDQNVLAIENLKVLNEAVAAGLWQGRARILELGASSLVGTVYDQVRSTAGAILNFHVAQGGSVFVGTEVSSYSVDLVSTRFYRGLTKNYKYLPGRGLVEWTPVGTKHAPGFGC